MQILSKNVEASIKNKLVPDY